MPLYYVEMSKTSGAMASGITQLDETDIEKAWNKLYKQAKKRFGDELFHFDAMMISKNSPLIANDSKREHPQVKKRMDER
jgi:hypothetical protein